MTERETDSDDLNLDANMVDLVEALNSIEGVTTFASCGGHANPLGSQVGAGKFMVSLDIDQNESGWQAIAIIAIAIDLLRAGDVKLSSWASTSDDGEILLQFDLSGEGILPDALAAQIRSVQSGINSQVHRTYFMNESGPADGEERHGKE
jgi:hypothetical protein